MPGDGQEGRGLASLEHLPWASPVPGFSEHLLLQRFLHPGWEAGQALICRQESPGLGSLLALLLPGVARFLSSQDPRGQAWSCTEGRWAWAGRGRGLSAAESLSGMDLGLTGQPLSLEGERILTSSLGGSTGAQRGCTPGPPTHSLRLQSTVKILPALYLYPDTWKAATLTGINKKTYH